MKKWKHIIGAVALTLALTGCSSTYFAASGYGSDDLYAIHDKAEIARRQQAKAEAEKAEAEARKAEWEARLAEAEANAVQRRYYETTASSNPYEEVLADTYESAYARRLRGFESPTYRMPSSYYNFRYGSSFNYVSAYDPAFYNVMVMGDQVWVEPKYITAMFGSWGRPSIYLAPWYYGWNAYRPYYGWGFSFGGWGWGLGWYDPWYYPGWGWGYPGHPHWGGGHPHGPRPPYRPHASNIVHRADPYASPSGGRYYRNDRQTGSYGTGSRGSSYRSGNRTGDFGVRGTSGGNRRQETTPSSHGNRSNTGSTYNRGTQGGNTYDRGNSNSNSYNRGNSNSNWGNSSTGSYNRGGSTGGSYNRGGSGGGSSRNAGGR